MRKPLRLRPEEVISIEIIYIILLLDQPQNNNPNDQNQKATFIKKVNLAKTVFDYSDENKDSKLKVDININ